MLLLFVPLLYPSMSSLHIVFQNTFLVLIRLKIHYIYTVPQYPPHSSLRVRRGWQRRTLQKIMFGKGYEHRNKARIDVCCQQ